MFVAPTTETVHLGFLTTVYSRTYLIWFLFTGSYHARRVLYCIALLVYCCSGRRVIQHLERCLILSWMKYMNVMSLVTLLSPFWKILSRKYVESIIIYLFMVYIGGDWSNYLVNNESESVKGKWLVPDLECTLGICLEGLRKMMKHLKIPGTSWTWSKCAAHRATTFIFLSV